MNFGPFDTAPLAARLRDQVNAFADVGEASDIQSVLLSKAPTPCAYVILGAETPGKREGGSIAYRQRNTAIVSVLIGVRVYGDEIGGDARPELRDLLTATRNTSLAWKSPGADTVFEFHDARVLSMDEFGVTWWLERYRCDYWLST